MAESVTAHYDLKLIAEHTVALGLDDAADPTTEHDIGDVKGTLTSSSSVAVTKAWSDTGALVAGAATIDLTALDFANLPTADWTGLKVKAIEISCPSMNSAGVGVAPGAANPYDIWGRAATDVFLLPGTAHLAFFANQLENVDATHKTIDLSSADLDATYSIIMIAGGT